MPETQWYLPNFNGTHAGHSSVGYGTVSWYATERIRVVDGSGAEIGPFGSTMPAGTDTEWLRAEDFRASVPADAVITGLAARIRARKTGGAIEIKGVCLRADAQYTSYYPLSLKRPNQPLTTSYQTFVFGGPTDQWGIGITRELLAKSVFGVSTMCRATASGSNVHIDSVEIKVYYNTSQAVKPQAVVATTSVDIASATKGSVSVSVAVSAAASTGIKRAIKGSFTAPAGNVSAATSVGLVDAILSTARYFPAGNVSAATSVGLAGTIKGSVSVGASVSAAASTALAGTHRSSATVVPVGPVATTSTSGARPIIVTLVHPDGPVATTSVGIAAVRVLWDAVRLHPDFDRNTQQTIIKAYPVLVTIDHPDLVAPLRYTDAGIPLESNGHVFDSLPIDVRMPTSGRNQASEGQITLPIQSRQIRGIFRALRPPRPTVTIQMCYGDDPDRIALEWTMRMRATQTSGGVLAISLDDGDFESREFPPLTFDGRWKAVHD